MKYKFEKINPISEPLVGHKNSVSVQIQYIQCMSLISLQERVCDKCPKKWRLLLLKNPPKLGLEKLLLRKSCESVPINEMRER